jgi:hypothetical protein
MVGKWGLCRLMTKSILFELTPHKDFDFTQFIVDYSNGRPIDFSGCKLFHIPDPILYLKADFIEYIVKHGFTSYHQMQLILEDLTTPSTPPEKIESLLLRYLSNIGIDKELIIIDPYFFPATIEDSYPEMISKIIQEFASTLVNLRVVTAKHGKAFSTQTKSIVEHEIRQACPAITISHTTSNFLHDRFWISNNRKKGVVTGTSLNGLGKKYSIVDFLNDEDVEAIVSDFSEQNLI